MRSSVVFSFGAIALIAASALAHSGATGVVKERMDGMKEMSHAAKAMGAVRAGAIPFSFDTLNLAGREIARHGAAARTQFPGGSLTGPSEALPLIWTDRERFDQLMGEMVSAADRLAVSVDRDESMALVERIGATCKDCHATFRKKK